MVRQDFSMWNVIVLIYMAMVGASELDILYSHLTEEVMMRLLYICFGNLEGVSRRSNLMLLLQGDIVETKCLML